jgi:hypothetical protein
MSCELGKITLPFNVIVKTLPQNMKTCTVLSDNYSVSDFVKESLSDNTGVILEFYQTPKAVLLNFDTYKWMESQIAISSRDKYIFLEIVKFFPLILVPIGLGCALVSFGISKAIEGYKEKKISKMTLGAFLTIASIGLLAYSGYNIRQFTKKRLAFTVSV